MAKGHENLIPFSERTEDEQREIRQKGGVASGVARRRNKAIQELLELYAGKTHRELDEEGHEQTKLEAAVASFFERQIETGDAAGFEKLMKAMGQEPVQDKKAGEATNYTLKVEW